jgi:predicted protein tyrosine phosphatase
MKTILFICTGNVCRSPMAEALFQRAVAGRGEFRVFSAGLGAVDGHPPTAHSVTAMQELGMDISGQRSRMLTTDLVLQKQNDAKHNGGIHLLDMDLPAAFPIHKPGAGGNTNENPAPARAAEPQKPVIRDPVLERAVDLIKGLAVVRQSRP